MEVEKVPERQQNSAAEVEKSIRKKFHRSIWSKFAKAVKDYELGLG